MLLPKLFRNWKRGNNMSKFGLGRNLDDLQNEIGVAPDISIFFLYLSWYESGSFCWNIVVFPFAIMIT